jgi:hypothetical protein
VRVGRSIGRYSEAHAVLQVPEEEVHATDISGPQASRISIIPGLGCDGAHYSASAGEGYLIQNARSDETSLGDLFVGM